MKERILPWLAVGACAAAAFWISNGVAPWDGDRSNMWHHYEYLAEGFLHGHTYLSVEPAPELLRLKNPYDPAANAPYRLWDASLYNGKFYLYFGPTPALVMLPWRIATGHEIPQRLVAALFAAAGLAGLALLLLEVRNRLFPRLPGLVLAAIVVVSFHASWIPVTLRRSGVWDLPIVAATACAWWALYFLWKFHDSGGRTQWAAATGLALALLMGSRATFVPGAMCVALLLLAPPGDTEGARPRNWRGILAGAAIAAAGGLALLAYNRVRFGSWTEFGLSYVMFGEDYRGIPFSSPRFVPFNAWTYLLSLPRLGPYFPFVHPFWSDDHPAGFVGFEEVYGVLYMMPVHLLGLVALAWAAASRGAPGIRAVRVTLAGALLVSASSAVILFCWAWACSRYTNELLAGWTVATSIGLMAVFDSDHPPRSGRWIRILAVASSCWTVAFVWLASAQFRGFMARTNPRTYAALAHVLDYPSLWSARAQGVKFGPMELAIRVPPSPDGTETALLASGRPQMANQLLLRRVDRGHVRLILVANEHTILATPDLDVPDGTLHVRLSAPWLYPPAAHPYWDALDPAGRQEGQTLFSIEWDSGRVYNHSGQFFDPVSFEPAVQGPSGDSPGMPYVESMAAAAPRP
jgi:hypothetical protein